MQNLCPSNIKVTFQRPSCGSPIAVASGFIAGTAPVQQTNTADRNICLNFHKSSKGKANASVKGTWSSLGYLSVKEFCKLV